VVDLPVPRSEIISRLKKIEGQVRGVQNMVHQERDCVDILVQLSATKSAIQSVAALVLRNYTSICMNRRGESDIGADLAHAVAIWVGGRA
jgi:DNA-binding FrmR family transcriptional regulator